MTGKALVKRILLTLAATAGFFIFVFAIQAEAMPIRPDLQKILAEPQEAAVQVAPARAGWQGPEMSLASQADRPAGVLDPLRPREVRASLIAAVTPNPVALVLVILAILLLRRVRRRQPA